MIPRCLLGLLLVVAAGCASPRPLPTSALTFAADESLFTLYAYLNAAGYDQEAANMPMHPLRQRIRQALERLPQADHRRRFFQQQAPQDAFVKVSLMTDYLFFLSPAPRFEKIRPERWWGRELGDHLGYLWRYRDLDRELRRFHQAADLTSLWQEAKPVYDNWIARIQVRAEGDVGKLQDWLRLADTVPVTVMPNFLAQQLWSHTSSVPGQAFLMIGPQPHLELDAVNIRHEFLHPQIDPLVNRHRALIAPKVALVFPLIEDTPAVQDQHYDRETIVEESLIRAVEAVFFGRERRPLLVERQYREGFIFLPAFAEALDGFFHADVSLETFIQQAFTQLDAEREWSRWQKP